MDEVILNKAAIIERCLRRIRSLQGQTDEQDPYLYEDALLLNLERACQAAIDLAMHVWCPPDILVFPRVELRRSGFWSRQK